jgi:hypothetical protein
MKTPAVRVLMAALFFAAHAGAQAESSVQDLNTAFGWPLFPESGSLWEERADDVAMRLGLPPESQTRNDASYRAYPREDVRVLGRRPYAISLNAVDGKPVALNLVFANKGDTVGQFVRATPGVGRQPRAAQLLREYRRAISADERALEDILENLLGDAAPERAGSGGKLQERSQRRDWRGHAVLLVSVRDEYVALRIVPSAELEGGGAIERVSSREMRERLAALVLRRPNGDVLVEDIPMVDQGPKGFCVPATMERMLRHLGIPSDMYLLAMAANTQPGGGTSVRDVLYAVGQTARQHGRRLVTVNGRPDPSTVATWIEAGIPILWSMNTSEEVNEMINEHTRERQKVEDWSAWKAGLKDRRREVKKTTRSAEEGHVCLITGFNRDTGEIAISDSWGPDYEERWLTSEAAQAISTGSMAVVAW